MSKTKKSQTKEINKKDFISLFHLTAYAAVLLLIIGLAYKVQAAPNTPISSDSRLDTIGKALTSFDAGSDDGARAVAIQSDGKIVAAGLSSIHNFDFALVRYNPNGSRDNSFSNDGKVTTNFGGDDEANAVAIQSSDSKIVAAGFSDVGVDFDFALARYNTDGSRDSTFSSNGRVTTNFKNGSGCAIGGPVRFETAIANVLIPLVPALAIGLRVLIRKRKKVGMGKER
ncbi:MAG: hypothetical protein C4291_02140 [Candidatus Dadabacteria bacterium]